MSSQLTTEQDEFGLMSESTRIKDFLKNIAQEASNLEMTSELAYKRITSIYSDAKAWEKIVDNQRKEFNAPYQEVINKRNDKAKEILDPLKEIISLTKQKASDYQAFVEEKKRIEEESLKAAAHLLDIDVPYLMPVDKNLRGDGAMTVTRTVRKFRTVDLSKVPLKYIQINEDAVKEAIKLGVNEIPGLEIFEEQVTTLRSR